VCCASVLQQSVAVVGGQNKERITLGRRKERTKEKFTLPDAAAHKGALAPKKERKKERKEEIGDSPIQSFFAAVQCVAVCCRMLQLLPYYAAANPALCIRELRYIQDLRCSLV